MNISTKPTNFQAKLQKISDSRVKIEVQISAEEFEKSRKKAVEQVSKNFSFEGFRPGKIPEKILKEKIGEGPILEEMANLVVKKFYPEIMITYNLEPVALPKIEVKKLAPNNPLEFDVEVEIIPKINLDNWQNFAKEIFLKNSNDEIVVDDKEIDEVINHLKKTRKTEKNISDDEFAKSMGNFNNIKELKDAIRKNLLTEKEMRHKEKKRIEAIEYLIKKFPFEPPKSLVVKERDRMFEELKFSIEKMGMNWNNYLKEIKKTEDDLKKEFLEPAEKRIKMGIILREIAKKEKIEIPQTEIEKETQKIISQLLNQNQSFDKNQIQAYVVNQLTNEKVFQLIESLKE